MLTTGEMFPASRLLTEEAEGTEMEGVEHLGQYVFEMTQAKMEMLKRGENVLLPQDVGAGAVKYEEVYSEGGEEKVEDEGGEVNMEQELDRSQLDEIT